jgi:protein-export membrane protein SecD
MTLRKKVWLTFAGIIVIILVTGLIDYPKGPNIKIGNYYKELKIRLGLDLQGGTHLVYDADTSQIAEKDKASALEGVRDVIERRVNAFGVSEPVVQTNQSGGKWRVIVELPGITDVNQAIKMIGETPLLEFKEQKTQALTDQQTKDAETRNAEAKKSAEDVLKKALEKDADFAALANQYSQDPGNTDSATNQKKGGDLGLFTRDQMVTEFSTVVFDKMKVGEVYPELVQTQYGYHIIKKTSESGDKAQASHILFLTESTQPTTDYVDTGLSGKQLKTAAVEFAPNTNEPEVSLEFNEEGKKLFADITTRNVGKIVGIYLDGSPISMPKVNVAITDGKAVISGSFDLTEAKLLAQRLNAGALPVPITLVNQQSVGATLGKIAIQKSLFAGIVGLVFVAIFMIIYYRLPGLMAIAALCIYTLIVLALFKLFSITLTLAGIAGFILSIGMAVDANVLIFERTKEELRSGKNLTLAIEEGFKRAWLSIRDSNASSLITCVILAWFGTSIVKGFAITLGIGVLVSMFSAITVTRTLLRLIISRWLEEHHTWFGGVRQQTIKNDNQQGNV